jgi:hypothetical protein
MPQRITEIAPGHEESISGGSMLFESGTEMTIWSVPGSITAEPAGEIKLQIDPHRPVVIGRAHGHEIPYLDPKYSSTPILPETGQCILNGGDKDCYVSRGHFMLRGNALGIVLVNGVPQAGGGIRPPRNWTCLLAPVHRFMERAEEYLIEKGRSAKIYLPNGTVILINAE